MERIKLIDQFSKFGYGYRNKDGKAVLAVKPEGSIGIRQVFEYIISPQAKLATDQLRRLVAEGASHDEISDFKKLSFRIVTFAGVFSYRKAEKLVERSRFLVLDIDDLSSEADARALMQRLISDPYVVTELCFLSPKGRGVKWIISLPEWWQGLDVKLQFEAARQHVVFHYGIAVDVSGSDVCRACFLPHDPLCYINPRLLSNP